MRRTVIFGREVPARKTAVKASHYYRPQRSWAKVIFSQASVCPRGGGVSASVHAGIYPPRADHLPPDQTSPPGPHPPRPDPPGADPPREQTPSQSRHPPRSRPPPPPRKHQHTVNERPVRILQECILVLRCERFSQSDYVKFFCRIRCWFQQYTFGQLFSFEVTPSVFISHVKY